MRYSRMIGKPPKKKKRYTNLIVIIIILGIAAYFVGAGATGGWLAENVINPVFNSGDTNAADTTDDTTTETASSTTSASSTDTAEETAETVNLPETSGTRVEENITAEEISLYTLQTGAFSDESNAIDVAEEVVSRGGAGFVAYDGELYRVLIAGYTTETDANSVKETLEGEGISTSVFELKSGSLEFKIGADQSQIDAVKECFEVIPESVTTLQQIIFDSDQSENVDEDIEALQQIVTETTDNLNEVVSSDEGAIVSLSTYMEAFCEKINNISLSSSVSEVEFSSELKYNLISIVVDYSAFLDELSS